MVKNERGSTLLVVMLMVFVFSVLGLAILSASIGGAKRTEIREEQIQTDLEDIKTLNEAVAYIKEMIEEEYNKKNPEMTIQEFKDLVKQLTGNPFGYTIEDLSETPEYEEKINVDKDYTRVLQISSGEYSQRVYIRGLPSFLKYAAGSRGVLTLNGSTYFEEGNIYANEKLRVSKQAKYIYSGNKVKDTHLSSVSNTNQSYIFIEGEKIEMCNPNCYNNGNSSGDFHPLSLNNIDNAFEPYAPIFTKETTEYVGVNIDRTFKEKLLESGFNGSLQDDIQTIIEAPGEHVKKIDSFRNFEEDSSNMSYLLKEENNTPVYFDTNRISLDKRYWIVIDGNAVIDSDIEISANILVNGNLTIYGEYGEEVEFDSTIYVLGDTTINNFNIKGFNDGELILMSDGELEIAKINKWKEDSIIEGYLYTSQDAILYAMGSYLYVEGGIFANGDLEINAYRGKATEGVNDIDFTPDTNPEKSRLRIKKNNTLFLNHVQGLPKVDRLEVVTDLMKKE